MKPKITLNKTIAVSAFAFLLIFLGSTGAMGATLTVDLTGGFTNQEFTIDYGNGTYDDITVSATVDLVFTPSQPSCSGANFTSSTAQVNGNIHIWGSATRYSPGSSNTENFNTTHGYTAVPVSPSITFEGQTGSGGVQDLYWQIATSRDHDNDLPYRLHYYGDSHLLRLWISLPYPFWYNQNDEYYDTTGTATVSGQESVNSCLNGTVRDGATGQLITGASVRFGNVPQTTDSSGAFYYGNIPANTYQLIVTNAGYLSYTNVLNIPSFTVVQTNVFLNPYLTAFDANPMFLGSVFLKGATFPLDPADPKTPAAMDALAWAFFTRQGLVADGLTQLLIRFQSDTPGTVSFTHSNPAAGTLSPITGAGLPVNVPTTPLNGKNMAFALFTAPDYIATPTAADLLQASFVPDAGQPTASSVPITVKRAPVLLVHGLWGDSSAWKTLEPQLNANGSDTWLADYHSFKDLNAAGSFATYRGVVLDGATNLLWYERGMGLAATRVDVVAHSMGGILTRLDANDPSCKAVDNSYRGYLRRLITIDTPHWGSRAATVLIDLAAVNPDFNNLFNGGGHPIDQGGVADLDPRTFAQSVAARSASLKIAATHLPALSIACTVVSESDLRSHDELGVYLATKASSVLLPFAIQLDLFCDQTIGFTDSEMDVANKVFTTSIAMSHDGIVPVTSQQGGCLAVAPFLHVTHTGAPSNPDVMNQVVGLLQGDVSRFDPNGFPAVTMPNLGPQLCSPGYSGPALTTSAELVQLVFVPALLSVRPGSAVSFLVQAKPGAAIDELVITAAHNGSTIASATSSNLPFQFTFTAPTNSLGTINVSALAFNAGGQTDLEQTNLVVQVGPGINLQALAVVPNKFVFSGIAQLSQLAVTGTFSDGSSYDVTGAGSGVQYSSSALGSASVGSNGVVTAVSQGTGIVSVTYGAINTNLPFSVALQQPVVHSTTPYSCAPGVSNLPITLVGSALGGATKLEFFRNGVIDLGVTATNILVGAAGLNMTAVACVNSNALPGLRTVVVTTPAGRSTITNSQGNRFFVGTPLQIDDFQLSQAISNSQQIHLHIFGSPDGICVLQSSTNLTRWDPVATNTLLGGDWFFDKFLPAPQKILFYRATLQP